MKKKLGMGIVTALVAAVIFAAGFFAGTMFASDVLGFSKISGAYVEALPTWMAIKQADRGDYPALKRGLNQKLDMDIMRLDHLISKEKSGEDVEKGKALLKSIAAHREKFPPVYGPGRSSSTSANQVNQILSSYK